MITQIADQPTNNLTITQYILCLPELHNVTFIRFNPTSRFYSIDNSLTNHFSLCYFVFVNHMKFVELQLN